MVSDDPIWFAAHCRPRCEKRMADFCAREGIAHTLPLYRSLRKYRGKQIVFFKPLFPNYVFLRIEPSRLVLVRHSRYVAKVLTPPNQAEFSAQLSDILRALETDREVVHAPEIKKGRRVKFASGPLRGIEGIVIHRSGLTEVMLRLDFIGQGASVRVSAEELEPT